MHKYATIYFAKKTEQGLSLIPFKQKEKDGVFLGLAGFVSARGNIIDDYGPIWEWIGAQVNFKHTDTDGLVTRYNRSVSGDSGIVSTRHGYFFAGGLACNMEVSQIHDDGSNVAYLITVDGELDIDIVKAWPYYHAKFRRECELTSSLPFDTTDEASWLVGSPQESFVVDYISKHNTAIKERAAAYANRIRVAFMQRGEVLLFKYGPWGNESYFAEVPVPPSIHPVEYLTDALTNEHTFISVSDEMLKELLAPATTATHLRNLDGSRNTYVYDAGYALKGAIVAERNTKASWVLKEPLGKPVYIFEVGDDLSLKTFEIEEGNVFTFTNHSQDLYSPAVRSSFDMFDSIEQFRARQSS